MVRNYRKKPVIIEAIQWTGFNDQEIFEFCGDNIEITSTKDTKELVIHTLEGDMKASQLDFIIKGVSGEFYPCKPDIFEETYEKAE